LGLIILINSSAGPQRAARLKAILALSTLLADQGRLGPQGNGEKLPRELRRLAKGQPTLPLATAGGFPGTEFAQHCLDCSEDLATLLGLQGVGLEKETKGDAHTGGGATYPPEGAGPAGYGLAPGKSGAKHLRGYVSSQIAEGGEDNSRN